MGRFIRSRIAEFLACVCMSIGLCHAIYAGFVLTDRFSQSPLWVALAVMLITAVMYLFSYNRITFWAGIVAGVIFAAAVVIYMNVKRPWDDESANSAFLFGVITVVTCVLVFLITRSKAGCIVGGILANLIFAGSYFLEFPVHMWQYLLMAAGSVTLFLIRVYMISAKKANTGRIRIGRYAIQTVIVTLAAFLAAVGVFTAVIKPLEPPTMELQLLNVFRNMEIFEIFGVARTRQVYNPSKTGRKNSTSEDVNEEGDEEDDRPEGDLDDPEASNDPENDTNNGSLSDWITNSRLFQDMQAIAYDLRGPKLFLLIAVVLLLITEIFLLRILVRQKWRQKVQSLPAEDRVVNYYNFFLKRFRRIGYKKPDNYTLAEYSDMMEHQLEPYTAGESSFARLTDIYSDVYYGGRKVTGEEWELYEQYFDVFHRNIRRDIGTFKYILRIFRL